MTRTSNYLTQVRLSFIFKALAILASFLLIPIMIDYLGVELYGVWSTILSIVSWIVLFDLGIGNGLRNKLAESIAKKDIEMTNKVISTSYILIGAISLLLILVSLGINSYIPWNDIFNTSLLSSHELQKVMNIIFGFIIINFWLSLINQVLNGLQKTSIVVFNQFLSNVTSLVLIYILKETAESSLYSLVIIYGLSMIIANLSISFWFYSKNIQLIPKIKFFNRKVINVITSLGIKFFIIQIAVVIVFTTDKILITQLFGPQYVTEYDIVFKLFSIIVIGHSLISAPLWSAYTEAYEKNDFEWLKKTVKQQILLYLVIILFTFFLILVSPYIINIWIGKEFHIDYNLIVFIGIFVLITTWNNIFANFLNGLSITKLQMYTSIYAMVINIPISIFIVKFYHADIYGVVIGTIISLSLFAILGPIEVFKVLSKKRIKNI
jgi:O-antigen/teichoic acid export membrane protein